MAAAESSERHITIEELRSDETALLQDPEAIRRRHRIDVLTQAVINFCARFGLPEEVSDHMLKEALKTEEDDFADIAASLGHAAGMFAEDAKGDEVLAWPTGVMTNDAPTEGTAVSDEPAQEMPAALDRTAPWDDPTIFDEPPFGLTAKDSDEREQWLPEDFRFDDSQVEQPVDHGFVVSILGADYPIDDKDASQIARDIYAAAGEPQSRRQSDGRMIDPLARITRRVEGMPIADIAAAEQYTPGSVAQWFLKFQNKAAKPSVLVARPSEVAVAERKPDIQPLDDEPRHVQVAEKWSEYLGFDDSTRQALVSFFDPKSKVEMNSNKQVVADALRGVLLSLDGRLREDDFKLTPAGSRHVRKMLGVFWQNNQLRLDSPSTLAMYLRDANRKQPNKIAEIEQGVYDTFSSILAILDQAGGQAAPEAVVEDEAADRELDAFIRKASLTPEQAADLRRRLDVDKGDYSAATDETRSVAKRIQEKMTYLSREDYPSPDTLKALRGFSRIVLDGPMNLDQIASSLELDTAQEAAGLVRAGLEHLGR